MEQSLSPCSASGSKDSALHSGRMIGWPKKSTPNSVVIAIWTFALRHMPAHSSSDGRSRPTFLPPGGLRLRRHSLWKSAVFSSSRPAARTCGQSQQFAGASTSTSLLHPKSDSQSAADVLPRCLFRGVRVMDGDGVEDRPMLRDRGLRPTLDREGGGPKKR